MVQQTEGERRSRVVSVREHQHEKKAEQCRKNPKKKKGD